MYAIVEIAGKQFKVQEDDRVYVPRMAGAEVDSTVEFDSVLLVGGTDDVQIGTPMVDGAVVTAKVLDHVKGDKILVFKKKRRKRFKVKRGHRQPYTQLLVESVSVNGGSSKKKSKKADAPKTEKAEAKPAPKKAEKPVTPKEEKADNLTKIEGIGPKTAEILNGKGITTFAALAELSADTIRTYLEEAGSRFTHLEPASWPEQAQLAADGKWDELKELQDKLDGGRYPDEDQADEDNA